MLQKADPSGELHVRVAGGTPTFAERKEGYWDGYYTYIEDGKMVFSTRGNKIDLHSMGSDDWVERYIDDWEDRIEFDFTYLDDTKMNRVKDEMRDWEKEIRTIHDSIHSRQFMEILRKLEEGWRIYEENNAMYFKKEAEIKQLNIGEESIVRDVSFFHKKNDEWLFFVV